MEISVEKENLKLKCFENTLLCIGKKYKPFVDTKVQVGRGQ